MGDLSSSTWWVIGLLLVGAALYIVSTFTNKVIANDARGAALPLLLIVVGPALAYPFVFLIAGFFDTSEELSAEVKEVASLWAPLWIAISMLCGAYFFCLKLSDKRE